MPAPEFTGPGIRLTEGDHLAAARRIDCDVAAIRAVIEVESRGGFLPDGRPRILFERHIFHRLTGGRFGSGHSAISSPRPGGYYGGAREYDRLHAAIAFDRSAALQSASWGAFQIMGFNHELAGHGDVEAFVATMVSGEPAQLQAFIAFLSATGLDAPLRNHDWAAFARGYNGPAYARNRYDEKLATAWRKYADDEAGFAPAPLRRGDRGDAVRALQAALGLLSDGIFGPVTEAALKRFQRERGLTVDGIFGPQSRAALEGHSLSV